MREKIAKPLKLSDDWDNNLYRNVVHVLAESEGMIPGGQAERVISVVKALICEEIEKMENPYLKPKTVMYFTYDSQIKHEVFEECRQKILALLRK